MLVVGERINATRTSIAEAIVSRDVDLIQREAKLQLDAGAQMLDVNAGSGRGSEPQDLGWLVEVAQQATELPLCLDSSDPQALRAALMVHKGTALVNSVTAEKHRLEATLPLVKEHEADVIALTMGDRGMPAGVDDRLELVRHLTEQAVQAGIALERVYVDPLVRPLATEQPQAAYVLETVRRIKDELPEAKVICGLSNVSFGLPARALINRTFLVLMMQAGMDAAIIDPTQPEMMEAILASSAIAGEDEFCLLYIQAARAGRLAPP